MDNLAQSLPLYKHEAKIYLAVFPLGLRSVSTGDLVCPRVSLGECACTCLRVHATGRNSARRMIQRAEQNCIYRKQIK